MKKIKPKAPPRKPEPLHFHQSGVRQIGVGHGLTVQISYLGVGTMVKIDHLDHEVVPLFAASAAMATALRRIADGDVPGMPTMFDDPCAPVVRALQEIARRALPKTGR